eukprot:4083750-Pyramimonas_sp.AAC.1
MRWGTESRVVGGIAAAGQHLLQQLREVDLKFALDKSRILSNFPKVRASIAAKLKSPQPLPVRSERNLGVDYGSGKVARLGAVRERVACMRPRLVRMGFLKGTEPRRRVLGRMARAALESS